MTVMQRLLGASAVLALSAGTAAAEPALIFDLGGKFDKSFNEAAFAGAQRWAAETGDSFREIELHVGSTARAGASSFRRSWCEPCHHDWLCLWFGSGRSRT